MHFLRKIWNYDFATLTDRQVGWLTGGGAVVVLCLVFGVYDLLFDTAAGFVGDSKNWISQHLNPFPKYLSVDAFSYLLYGAIAFLFVYITAIALHAFFLSLRRYGRKQFSAIFWPHFLSNVLVLGFNLAFFGALGGIAYALGFRYSDGERFFQNTFGALENFIKAHIPTIFVFPKPFAFAAGIFIGALPGYISHWLCHKSRLLWYVTHRCHHTAEIMHPAGIGPFNFLPEIFLALPMVFFSVAASKLFTYEPMFAWAGALGFIYVVTEKFNHNTAHYNFAYSNPVVRHLSHYYGNGVYHYMHHTAKQGDEIVNVGGSPFLIWDRIFRTYRTPTAIPPAVGLTNTPIIVLSPFKIMFAGFEQLVYELRHNKSWWERFKIIFGDIYYKPPVTKDFLIMGYKEESTVDSVRPTVQEKKADSTLSQAY